MKIKLLSLILISILFSCVKNEQLAVEDPSTNKFDVRSISYSVSPKEINVGDFAPNFTMNPDSENRVELKELRNKVVMIYFGASWCVNCRVFEPKLNEIFENENPNGFELIKVRMDYEEEEFIETIKSDSKYYNVFNQKRYKNLSQIYPIGFYPYYYLINKYGEIIGRGDPRSTSFSNQLKSALEEE